MRTDALDVPEYFEPIVRRRPWRARLGVGSFLTFDFGRRVKEDHHLRGEWHLWIYQATWRLTHDDRKLADSDSEWQVIEVAIRRLEDSELTKVKFDPQNSITEFRFGDFRLVVSPADYLDDPDDSDEYWLLFMPDGRVLTVGPGGVDLGASDPHTVSARPHEHRPDPLLAQPKKRAVYIPKED